MCGFGKGRRGFWREVITCLQILEKGCVNRVPTEQLTRVKAGDRRIDSNAFAKKGILQMLYGAAYRHGDCREVQPSSDQTRDGLEGDAALPCTVQSAACRSLFDGEPVECGCISTVNCRPAVRSIGDVRGDACSPRGRDQERNEAVVPRPMHCWRQPQHDAAYSLTSETETRLLAWNS